MTIDIFTFRRFKIPTYMRAALIEYVLRGRSIGGFLQAVIANDLYLACIYADDTNIYCLPAYVNFFYCYTPALCHGGENRYKQWTKLKGIEGLKAQAKEKGARPYWFEYEDTLKKALQEIEKPLQPSTKRK